MSVRSNNADSRLTDWDVVLALSAIIDGASLLHLNLNLNWPEIAKSYTTFSPWLVATWIYDQS
jgi:hypothetical protein